MTRFSRIHQLLLNHPHHDSASKSTYQKPSTGPTRVVAEGCAYATRRSNPDLGHEEVVHEVR